MNKIKYLIFLSTIFLFGMIGVHAENIENGFYTIESAIKPDLYLIAHDGKSANGVNVEVNNQKNNGIWKVQNIGSGYYSIVSAFNENISLDVNGAKKANGTNIWLYSFNNTDAQKWLLKDAGDGYFYIVSKCNNLYMDVSGGKSINGTNVQVYSGNETNAQKFKFNLIPEEKNPIADGEYIINSKLNSNIAVSTNGKSVDGANININQNNSTLNQVFNIKYLDNGYYEISNNNFLLNVKDNKAFNGANVQLNSRNNLDGIKWIIKKNFDDSYSIVSALGNYYMELAGGKTASETNIQLYHGNGTNAQKFTFTKVESTPIENGVYNISTNSNNNLFVTLNNKVAFNGANIELRNKTDENNQKWFFQNIEDNIYEIKSEVDENYAIEVQGGKTNNNTNIQIYKSNSTKAQRFAILKLSDGSYRFTNVNSSKNMDVKNGKIVNTSNIQQYENNNTDAQKFKIFKTNKSEYKQIIDNDNYIIYSAVNMNKSLRYNSNVYIYDVEGSNKELITIEYIGNGYYTLKNNGKSFTNINGKIYMNDYTSNDNQKWFAVKNSDFYTFISKIDGKVLDLPSGSVNNNNALQTYASNGTNAQKFYLEKAMNTDLKTGYYTISTDNNYLGLSREVAYNGSIPVLQQVKNINTQTWYIKNIRNNLYEIKYGLNPNKVLEVKGGKTANGTYVQTYNSNSTAAQRWYLIKLKDGNYKFVSSVSHTFMTANTNNTVINSNDKNKKQIFKLTQTDGITVGKTADDGYYTISTVLNNNKVLDIAGGKSKAGTNVQIYTANSSIAQIWKLYYIDNGLYYIRSSLNPKRALTNVNGNIQIETYTGADNQKWYIKMFENNMVSIISGSDSLYADVSGGKTANGTNVGVYKSNNTNAQKFILNTYGGTKTYRGIDVSYYQYAIDWDKVEKANTNFVIMRAGYGKYSYQKDARFEEYYKGASSRDIPIGVYTYSYAMNTNDAKKEAEVTLEWLKGKTIDLPVFYDLEEDKQAKLGKNTMTKIAETFCETIQAKGYRCGVYANKNWLTNYLNASSLANKYPIWVAHYTGPDDYDTVLNNINRYRTSYNLTPYQYWQFSSLGNVNGIGKPVDLDFGYNIFD